MSRIRPFVFASLVALASCAPAPMRPEIRSQLLAGQTTRLASLASCCSDWKDLPITRTVGTDGVDVDIGAAGTRVRTTTGSPVPVVGFRVPAHDTRRLEFRTYSDHGKLGRMDDRLFIRPDFVFLDEDFAVVDTVRDPALCMGYFDEGAALWTRVDVPARAAYVALSPSLARPEQTVDTRVIGGPSAGVAGNAVIGSIADARKSYIAIATMEYLGKISLREIDPDALPPGRCVTEAGR